MAGAGKLDDGLRQRVQRIAAARGRSADGIVREAVEQYVDREEARESFRQEALSNWAEFTESGRHLTGGEVRDWLSTWGVPEEPEAPDCHD